METLLNAAAQPAPDLIKDSSERTFAEDVVDASMQVPVIVDFWAPWCGPCKTLTPLLEKAVTAARGKVKLVKVNIDENQAIATQLRIQSIPTVYAFFQGRPVDGFMGALPESQLKQFVDKLAQMAGDTGGDPLAEALEQAAQLLEQGEATQAAHLYSQILQHDPENVQAAAGMAEAFVALGEAERAQTFISQLPDSVKTKPEVVAVERRIQLAAQAAGLSEDEAALARRVEADPADHQARYDLAMALFARGQGDAAIEALLEIVRRDRDWNEQAARKQLLTIFEALGPKDPAVAKGRRRLSSLLFS